MNTIEKIETDNFTVNSLIQFCKSRNISLDTKLSVMGSEIRYVGVQKDTLILDECNFLEELGLEDDKEFNKF